MDSERRQPGRTRLQSIHTVLTVLYPVLFPSVLLSCNFAEHSIYSTAVQQYPSTAVRLSLPVLLLSFCFLSFSRAKMGGPSLVHPPNLEASARKKVAFRAAVMGVCLFAVFHVHQRYHDAQGGASGLFRLRSGRGSSSTDPQEETNSFGFWSKRYIGSSGEAEKQQRPPASNGTDAASPVSSAAEKTGISGPQQQQQQQPVSVENSGRSTAWAMVDEPASSAAEEEAAASSDLWGANAPRNGRNTYRPGRCPLFDFGEQVDGEPRQPELLIGILSAPRNFEMRQVVRETWTKIGPRKRFAYYFLVGNAKDDHVNAMLRSEAEKHRDIFLCMDNYEDYRNISHKVLSFFDWASELRRSISKHPENAFKWIFKCDDDTFLRIDRLLEVLDGLPPTKVYWGYSHGVYWPHRQGKWGVTEEEYPTSTAPGPNFLCGPGYTVSFDVVDYISRRYEHNQQFRPFPLEDVGTALLVSQMGVRHMHTTRILCGGGSNNDFVATHYVDAATHRALAAPHLAAWADQWKA